MTFCSIDIETVPNATEHHLRCFDDFVQPDQKTADEWKLLDEGMYDLEYEKWRRKEMSLTPEYCRIVGLNWQEEGEAPQSRWVGEVLEQFDKDGVRTGETKEVDEIDLLRKFWLLAKKHMPLVTFNGLSFDLEVLKMRSAILGVSPNGVDLANLKPWENKVVDLMKRLYGGRKAMGLKKVRRILWDRLVEICPDLLTYEDIMDQEGGSVYELHQAGKYAELKRYGEFDALSNSALFLFGDRYWW